MPIIDKHYNVQSVTFDNDVMVLTVDGEHYHIPIAEASDRLLQASDLDRHLYKVSPSGYGIHWITLDEDLSIQGLLQIATSQEKVA